jgi:hypothetical protein
VGRSRDLAATLQWQRIESLLDHDFEDPSLLDAVAAGRGVDFQRLELLGDPVLELAVAVALHHAGRSGDEAAGAQLARLVQRRTSTSALGGVTLAAQLRALVGGPRQRKRHADLVEAAAGALFVDGGWAPVDRFAARCGLTPGPPPAHPGEPPAADLPPTEWYRAELALARSTGRPDADAALLGAMRVVGTLAVDTAMAWWAHRTMPGRDEGVLTGMVHERSGNPRLAGMANRVGLAGPEGRPENRLRTWVGLVTVEHGRAAGLALVSEVANLGLPVTAPPDPPEPPGSPSPGRPSPGGR